MIDVHLRPGREKQLLRGHPWVFAGAIRDLDPKTPAGTVARVRSADGAVLAVGYVNPRCTIALRICAMGDVELDEAFFAARLRDALALRSEIGASGTDVFRVVNGEGDFLPGFVVDRFGDVFVLQCLTAGADRLRDPFVAALRECCEPRALVDVSRGSVRSAEGLADREEVLLGTIPERQMVTEHGMTAVVTPGRGQKTGFYCDQRDNRLRLREMAAGRTVLDAFCYSGGFAVNAALGGARKVIAVDSSRDALDLLQANLDAQADRVDPGIVNVVRGKVGDYLRATEETFDVVVLDPPPLVRHRGDLRQGMRAYRDLNLWAMRRLAHGGMLWTFTCSQHVGAESLRRAVSEAAVAARCSAQVVDTLGPGIDHPIAAAHAEGDYLHGFLVRILTQL
jgi:23S rRNA (cytosine1962-C5)-methyltransferase